MNLKENRKFNTFSYLVQVGSQKFESMGKFCKTYFFFFFVQ